MHALCWPSRSSPCWERPFAPRSRRELVVLAIDLNNLHKTAPDSALAGRIARLGDALRARLATACGYRVILLDPGTEAAAQLTEGYFYDTRTSRLASQSGPAPTGSLSHA